MNQPSETCIADMLRAVRRSTQDDGLCREIADLVMECRADLAALGVSAERAEDETDPLVKGAVRSFVRWKFGLNNPDAAGNMEDYMQQRDELRKRAGYAL